MNVFQGANTSTLSIEAPLVQGCITQDQRAVRDIVWSCLVTIYTCIWVSVHPNIPEPDATWMKKALHRLELMIWSTLCPEFIVYWAAKQWFSAQQLARLYETYGWTQTHGHFIQMGGLMLYDGDTAIGVIGPQQLKNLHIEGKICIPVIKNKDIEDQSKADGLSKALVIVQTSWFVIQCIARKAEGLFITQMELVTVAFAILNGIMYFLWWNKPQDVQSTIAIPLLKINEAETTPIPLTLPMELVPKKIEKFSGRQLSGRLLSGARYVCRVLRINMILKRISGFIVGGKVTDGQLSVPAFYADEDIPDWVLKGPIAIFSFIIGIVFGAVHCAGWNFLFPSTAELIIWRISAIVIIGFPALGVLGTLLDILHDRHKSNHMVFILFTSIGLLTIFIIPTYVLARLALLVEAVISLRDLPAGAFAVVEWTLFIPHV